METKQFFVFVLLLLYTPLIPQFLWRQVHSPFQSEFYQQCNVVLHRSISCNLSFPWGNPVAAYFFFFFLLLFSSFSSSFFPFSSSSTSFSSIYSFSSSSFILLFFLFLRLLFLLLLFRYFFFFFYFFPSHPSLPHISSNNVLYSQFPHNMWPTKLVSLLFTVCSTFRTSLTLCNFVISKTIGPTDFSTPL